MRHNGKITRRSSINERKKRAKIAVFKTIELKNYLRKEDLAVSRIRIAISEMSECGAIMYMLKAIAGADAGDYTLQSAQCHL